MCIRDRLGVFGVWGDVVRLKQVNVGGVYGNEIEINSRLALATQVIIDNQHLLKDGMAVSVVKD